MAPTPGSAQGTTEPTARNFDCVATPHWPACGSQAAIEYVATSRALAIRELGEVEVEELTPRLGNEDGGDLGAGEGSLDLFGRLRADNDRPPPLVRGLEGGIVGDVVQHQRVVGFELALDRDLRDAAAGGSEPALSQTVAVSPGSSASTSTPGACCRSSSGVPASSGNVP